MFGDDVCAVARRRRRCVWPSILHAPVFPSRQVFVNFPNRHPPLLRHVSRLQGLREDDGLEADLLFLVGCQGVHGAVTEPSVMQIGPNPVAHGPSTIRSTSAAQCDVRPTLQAVLEALTRLHGGGTVFRLSKRREKVAALRERPLIEREEKLAREPEATPGHPSRRPRGPPGGRAAARRRSWWRSPRRARTTLLPFAHGGMTVDAQRRRFARLRVGAAIGGEIAVWP